jgi:hypothetical protein
MNVKNLVIAFLSLTLILINGCKKKTALIEDTTPIFEIEASPRKDSVNGVLRTIKVYSIEKGFLSYKQMYSRARFSKELLSPEIFNSMNFADVGSVYLNDIKFDKYGTESIDYGDSYPNYLTPPFTWKISGNGDFKAFTYRLEFSHPTFEGYTSIPDSIGIDYASQLYITGTDADSISVEFWCSCGQAIFKTVSKKDESYLLSAPELKMLSINGTSPIEMRVILTKNAYKTFGGKHYKFIMQTQIYKFIQPKV